MGAGADRRLELDLACGGERTDIDQRIEQLGLQYSVSSRLTSWVAIAEEPAVDPREPIRTERIPQALPYGMSMTPHAMRPPGRLAGVIDDSAMMVLGSSLLAGAASGFQLEATRQPDVDQLRERLRGRVEEADKLAARLSALEEESHGVRRLWDSLRTEIARLRRLIDRRERHHPLRRVPARGRAFATPGRPTATIEIVVTSGLEWRPAATVSVGGRTISVVERGTTRSGPVVAGSVVRVELAAPLEDLARSTSIEIACGDCELVIALGNDAR